MIILTDGLGLILVRQTDHAALSARIAAGYRLPSAIPAAIWPRFVEAVRHHDDGWLVEERRPRLDGAGRPNDFMTLPLPHHLDLFRRTVDLARTRDPYATVLTAMHVVWLSGRLDGSDPWEREEVRRFREEMAAAISAHRRLLLEGTPEERAVAGDEALREARALFTFFDGLSLMALGAVPPAARTESIPFGSERSPIGIVARAGRLSLEPWPFETPSLPLDAPAVRLLRKTFRSEADLARAIERGEPQTVRSELGPSKT
jgi:hypothetical protein